MKSSRVLASLSAFLSLSIAACDSSKVSPEDAGGHSAIGGHLPGSSAAVGSSAGAASAGTGGGIGTGTGGVDGGSRGGSSGNGGSGGRTDGGGAANDGGGSLTDGGAGSAEPVPGTMSIFDGKTLNGWQQGTPMLWSVVNGAIDGKGTTGGQLLMTQANYGDFRVLVSSNMVAVGGSGHLGICFWGGRTPVGQYNNCKLIIPPNGYTWDYSLGGALRGVTNSGNKLTINPTWNTTEILCFIARGFCRVAVNGTAVLTYQEPNLASIKTGPIGLQIHNGTNEEVQYKDVFVDPAPTLDKLLTVK